MTSLALRLPITDRAGVVNSVDARNLYDWLDPGRDFSTWLREITTDPTWKAGVDFSVFSEAPDSGSRQITGNLRRQPRVECALSIRVAKHVAMQSRTERGHEAREYFIACEAKANDPVALLGNPAILRTLLASYAERVEVAEAKIAADAPKVDGFDRLMSADGTVGFREFCQVARKATGANDD